MRPSHWLLAALLTACAGAPFRAQEPDPLKAALARPILRPDEALSQTQEFCDARIPRMPKIEAREDWEKAARRMRRDTLEKVIFRGEAARWREAPTRVDWLGALEGGPGYRIRKLRYEAVPGLWVPALLYEPEGLTGHVPVVLNVNGHDRKGKSADYKQIRCINQAKRGMLALNVEWYNMGQLAGPGFSHDEINRLDLCGTAGIAAHYLMLKRGLDVLLSLERADRRRVAVTGLSGGGWQTIFISALDPRVTLTDPVAGYSSFRTRVRYASDLGDSEQAPCDLATVTDYAHLTAMMAPRPTLLTFNAKDDCCFRADHALQPLLDAAGPVFRLFGREEALRSHVNLEPGTHNYLKDNREALYRMLGDHFYAGSTAYRRDEIPSEAEVKSPEQLQVELPSNNRTLHDLAVSLSRSLPLQPELPERADRAREWQRRGAKRLREIVRWHEYAVRAAEAGTEEQGDLKIRRWRLEMEGWTVPAVELARGEPRRTVLVLADGGRQAAAEAVRRSLDAGARVVALDPFYLGESLPGPVARAYLWALMVGTVGERPLGLQAAQVGAAARWLKSRGVGPLALAAAGPRAGLAALTAAALEPSVDAVETQGSLGSLKEAIESGPSFTQAPDLYCFGLLQEFDLQQIAALAAPRPVRFREPGDRCRAEMTPLRAWYRTLGADFDRLQQ